MGIEQHLEEHAGTYGWLGLAAYVVAWDVLAPETLSHAADRALEHKAMKYVAWGIGGLVTGHVMNILPPNLDLIHQVAKRFGIE